MFVRATARMYFTKCTIMYCKHPAGPRSANFCARMQVDIKILYFLDLHSQGKIFESNTLARAQCARDFRPIANILCTIVYSMFAKATAAAYRERTMTPIAMLGVEVEICQWMFAYSLIFLSELQRIEYSPMAFVGVCSCVCLRICSCI